MCTIIFLSSKINTNCLTRDGNWSWWYASYWNAVLFIMPPYRFNLSTCCQIDHVKYSCIGSVFGFRLFSHSRINFSYRVVLTSCRIPSNSVLTFVLFFSSTFSTSRGRSTDFISPSTFVMSTSSRIASDSASSNLRYRSCNVKWISALQGKYTN